MTKLLKLKEVKVKNYQLTERIGIFLYFQILFNPGLILIHSSNFLISFSIFINGIKEKKISNKPQ